MATPALKLGEWREVDGTGGGSELLLPAHHLVTHGVVVGMTGSGKTGLLTVLVEEALRVGVPTLVVDVKGDLPNLLLSIPNFDPAALIPWLEAPPEGPVSRSPTELAARWAQDRREGLALSSIGEHELGRFDRSTSVRVLTPGATAGEPVHVLSTLERRSSRWDTDPEEARDARA